MKRRASLLFFFACLCTFLFAGLTACTSDDDDNGGTPTGTVDGGTDGGVTGTKDGGGTRSDGGTASDAGGGDGGPDGGTSNEGGTGGGSFTVGGLLSGLADGDTVVLQDNGGDNLTLTQNGAFTFAMSVANGGTYAVSVLSQPTTPAQTCGISSGSGTISGGSVGTVEVVCTTAAFTVGGTVSGLTGTGLALNDGTEDLVITANGAFTFAHPLASGTSFTVSVKTQPTNPVQTCKVAAGTGTIGQANVTSVSVNCDANKFTISGTVTGLTGTGLVLQDNAGDNLMVSSASFAFATTIASGQPYKVTVFGEPTGPSQTCTVTNGSGTVEAADVTNITIACTTTKFTVGGTLTGLGAGDSVVLQDNGGDNLTVTANGMFTFATSVASGASYVVTAMAPTGPIAESCMVTGGSSKVGAGNVTSVAVACTPTAFTVGGTISGLLTGQSVVLQDNNGDNLTVAAGATTFTFATPVASGAAYAVTVKTQPATGSCHLFERTGTVGTGPVTTVTATCGIDYYVNMSTGVNSGAGTTAAAPWKSITYAIATVPTVGGIINVAPGTYDTTNGEIFPIVPKSNQTFIGDIADKGRGFPLTTVSGLGIFPATGLTGGQLAGSGLDAVIGVPTGVTGVALRGLNVVAPVAGAPDVTEGIASDNGSVTVADCTISGVTDVSLFPVNGANFVALDSVTEDGGGMVIYDATTKVKARRNTFHGDMGDYLVVVGGTAALTGTNVDFGTASDPGGNSILASATGLGLHISGATTGVLAAGNLWNPNVQGASATGTYAHSLVPGPVAGANGNNYDIAAGGSIQF